MDPPSEQDQLMSDEALEQYKAANRKAIDEQIAKQIENKGHALTAEETIAVGVEQRFPSFAVYLSINGKAVSSPAMGKASSLYRPSGGSLDHYVTTELFPSDYANLTVKHNAFGLELPNPALGETRILVKDISNLTITHITDSYELTNAIRKYSPDIEKVTVAGAVMIRFAAAQVDHNVNWMAQQSLALVKKGLAKQHLVTLSKALLGDTTEFEMLVLSPKHSDFDAHAQVVLCWERVIRDLMATYESNNPLNWFLRLSKIKDISDVKQMPFPEIPDLQSGPWPDIPTLPRSTRYHSKFQMALYHLIGSKFEHQTQTQRIWELSTQAFDVFMLPCSGVQDGKQALMVVNPDSRGHLLPQDGELCTVKPPVIRRQTQVNAAFIDSVLRQVGDAIRESSAKPSPIQYLVDKVSALFETPPTADEVKSLLP
ncbi:hypothetical protein F5Y19DRAFT_394929 [Xylariaceae sp. FL1651]|nr:hypothetical protein F5Y19DRAFT_394929 [Xylariaceae sp. FL1651]